MSKVVVYSTQVEFGDCDPAGIVFFPNFLRWYDASSHHFFRTCGVPAWRDTERNRGIIGTPMVDIGVRFIRPATYGDQIEVHTSVLEWHTTSFVMLHQLQRDGVLLSECRDTRVFAMRHPEDATRIKAMPIPEDIRQLCS